MKSIAIFTLSIITFFSQNLYAENSIHLKKEEKKIKYDIVVAQDGSGNYKTIQEAFDAVPKLKSERTVIYVKNGIYKQVITLEADRNNVTLIGEEL